MEFIQFVNEIENCGFGVVALNTYMLTNLNHVYIMIASKGDSGIFYKRESPVTEFESLLDNMRSDAYFHHSGKLVK